FAPFVFRHIEKLDEIAREKRPAEDAVAQRLVVALGNPAHARGDGCVDDFAPCQVGGDARVDVGEGATVAGPGKPDPNFLMLDHSNRIEEYHDKRKMPRKELILSPANAKKLRGSCIR